MHLLTLLNSLVQQPDARLSDLPLLTDGRATPTAGGVE